jgi:hypothetical protein
VIVKTFLTLLLFLPFSCFSQIEKVSKFIEVGISPLSYKGDLSQGYEKWTSAFHIGLKRNTKKKVNGHFDLMIGSVEGQNINYAYNTSASPNKFFKTNVASLNYDIQFNILKKERYILYISQGIGLIRFVPKDEFGEELSGKFNTRAKNEIFNNISFMFPQSIGFMYFFKNDYGAGFQLGRLTPATDYIDNISKLSNYKKPDNIFMFKFSVLAPISYKKNETPK